MSPVVIFGSILGARTQVIAHQTNCKGAMDSGITEVLALQYPEIVKPYRDYCGNNICLGTCQLIPTNDGPIIANLFGQNNYSKTTIMTEYDAFKNAINSLIKKMEENNLTSVAMSYNIGCGLGGGDWTIIQNIITQAFTDTNIRVELWKYISK